MSAAHDKFMQLCGRFGLKETHREESAFGSILVGERYANAHAEHPRPSYCVLWFVRRGGNDDIARRLYVDFGTGSTQESRVNAALADARQFVKDAAHRGYFTR